MIKYFSSFYDDFFLSILKTNFIIFPVGLSDKRSPEEKQAIVDELFERYENEVAKCPEDHGIDLVCAYMLIEKNPNVKSSPSSWDYTTNFHGSVKV